MSVEAGQVVRAALDLWLTTLNLAPESDIVADQPAAGERPAFPHVGIAWGPVTTTDNRLLAASVDDDGSTWPGAATWLLGYDEATARFVMRATSPEDADRLAHEFRGRFALAAMRSNPGGDPVLHFDVELGGETRKGKVYLSGTFTPPAPTDVETRSLYVQSLDARVVYPRFWVDEIGGDETGQMFVKVSLDGVEYQIPGEEYPP